MMKITSLLSPSPKICWGRLLYNCVIRCALNGKSLQTVRLYARNPLERRTREQLTAAVAGGRGGRGGRGRKRGGTKGLKHDQVIKFGEGVGGVRWPGLSFPLERKPLYGTQWLQPSRMGIQKVEEGSADFPNWDNEVSVKEIEGNRQTKRKFSEMGWSRRGWSGKQWKGRYVGCPEAPDGTPLTAFRSVVIELKRVVNQTAGGKKRTVSALVVVGNGNGAAGFAVGKGEDVKTALRKAKNKAVNYLQFIPRCDDHTIYHNIQIKHCQTKILMERRVQGTGLSCHRAIMAICGLVGLKDMRAKIVGSTNPLNIVRTAFKGLTSQQTHQSLADESKLFLVEYRREANYRPVVVAVPKPQQSEQTIQMLKSLQMLPKLDN